MDVRAALSEIEPDEFEEWMALYDLEPWGDDWQQTAMVAAMVRNSSMGAQGEPVAAKDLIPNIDNRSKSDELDDESLTSSWKKKLGF